MSGFDALCWTFTLLMWALVAPFAWALVAPFAWAFVAPFAWAFVTREGGIYDRYRKRGGDE